MNESYLEYYMDMDGKLSKRSFLQSFKVVTFAGIKFTFDRLFAVVGLIIAAPLMLIIAIAIKIDSKGDVLFKQVRTGKNGKNFTMYKFRTMVQSNDVHDFKKSDEHTRVGKILRKTSLDELPQLFSIATGKMSFIGPRPWITDYYENMNNEQRHRNDVRPGLTGLAQVMGRNNLTIFDKISYDIEYVNNYSLKMDIKVIFLTIKTVLSRTGAELSKSGIHDELKELHDNYLYVTGKQPVITEEQLRQYEESKLNS